VRIVQQGVWHMPLASMPLAAGYLKSTADADPVIRAAADIGITNFRGSDALSGMAAELFGTDRIPDLLAFSIQGWNIRAFGALTETFKQLNPLGWVVFGGTHVAHQEGRVMATYPDVDVIVNGEGELVFRDILHAYLDRRSPRDLGSIAGISFRGEDGRVITTPERERLADLDVIPSPFLSGTIPLADESGRFPYDVALMETNRGCPYKCSFCYWGGAVGQRVRSFSRERLRAELELIAQHQIDTVVLCDANFGMLNADAEFVTDLLEIRSKYGFPKALESSWAKNKSDVFYRIVKEMSQAGLRSSFTLALQTLNDVALTGMRRRNMKVNDWEDLASWLYREGLDCYAEIIWGAPGETVASVLDGYDQLARRVSRIAAYPLLLLPNTEYSENKAKFGFVTVRGERDDFEYVIANNTVTLEEHRLMQRFLFWARALAENMVLRHIWIPLRNYGGLTQSQVLMTVSDWFDATADAAAAPTRSWAARGAVDPDALSPALSWLFGDPAAEGLLWRWWQEAIEPKLSDAVRPLLTEIFRYDLLTRPVYPEPPADAPGAMPIIEYEGEQFYCGRFRLAYDIPAILAAMRRDADYTEHLQPVETVIHYKLGFDDLASSTNHEESAHFMGRAQSSEVIADDRP
jgi:radical SAM C-methyltransferase